MRKWGERESWGSLGSDSLQGLLLGRWLQVGGQDTAQPWGFGRSR